MAIKLKRQAPGSVVNPPASHVAFFIDQNGVPSLKDSAGAVAPAVSITGNPLDLTAQLSPPGAEPSKVKLYAKSVLGNTEFFALDEQGREVQITSAGALAVGAPVLNWKGGTPGNPYISGDIITAAFNSIIMIDVGTPDSVTINLPAITPGSAALTVGIRNRHDKKVSNAGVFVLVPDPADAVEAYSTGAAVQSQDFIAHATFESDGVGRWNFSIFGGGVSVLDPGP